ncbi:MAG: hydrogenase maturation protease [Desulfobulbaceae bacterium]|nr:hydrogenase maturation protease [Desulfobulbaceae bacterium]
MTKVKSELTLRKERVNPFLDILQGKIVIMGIGNILQGDDGLGCELVNRLQSHVNALCIDTGPTPENYLGKAIEEDPDTLLFIDAVHLNKQAGEFAIMQPEELAEQFPATHGFPLRMLIEQFSRSISGKIFFLGVQPQTVKIGDSFSVVIRNTLQRLEQWIVEAVNI